MPIRAFAPLAAIVLLAAPAFPQALSGAINDAIDRGIQSILAHQQADGSIDVVGAGAGYNNEYPMGPTALAVYTLLKSGVPRDDPAIQAAMKYLRGLELKKTYAVSCYVLALDAMRDPSLDLEIQRAANWLASNFNDAADLWGYPDRNPELSNTQFAVLALWAAEKHGYHATKRLWADLIKGTIGQQTDDGGFNYRWNDRPSSHGTMTTAGITVLELAIERLQGEKAFDKVRGDGVKSLERGWAWMDEHFTATGNPTRANGLIMDRHKITTGRLYMFHYYYLWGVERIAAISQRNEIAGRDWYREGAVQFLREEEPGGGWNSLDTTCFALLFLRRATYSGLAGREQVKSIPRAITWRYTTEEPPDDWMKPGFDDSKWLLGPASFGDYANASRQDRTLWNTDDVWIRREFECDDPEAFRLYAVHDDSAELYVNGELAASSDVWSPKVKEYEVSEAARATLKEGTNLLAAHAKNDAGARTLDVWTRDFGRRAAHAGETLVEEPPGWYRAKPTPDAPFVGRWLVLGPIDDKKHALFHTSYLPAEETAPEAGQRHRGQAWRAARTRGGFLDFHEHLKPKDDALYYAFTRLEASEDTETVLWIGSDDGVRVYYDGELVLSHHAHQGAKPDELPLYLRLTEGTHRLLLMVENASGGCGLYARLTDLDRSPARTVRPVLSEVEMDLPAVALAHPGLFTFADLLALLPTDTTRRLAFTKEDVLDEVCVTGAAPGYPSWLAGSAPKNKDAPAYAPSPGAKGLLALWPAEVGEPAKLIWKARVPTGEPELVARASAEALSAPGETRVSLRAWVYDGDLRRVGETELVSEARPSKKGWVSFASDLSAYAGSEVLIILECIAPGEPADAADEADKKVGAGGAFLDEVVLQQAK